MQQFENLDLAIVATYGRSGSSRLMELLKLTGACNVAGEFPYETRSVQFGLLCALGLGEVAESGAITYGGFTYVPPVRRRGNEDEREFRFRVGRDQEYFRPYSDNPREMEPKFVAEKAVGLKAASVVIATIPRAFVVLIDRDPRDVFLSILAFNSKRGFDSFGAEKGTLVLAQRLSEYYASAAAFYTEHGARVRVVPYREIVERPLDAVQRVSGRFKHERDADAPNLSEITSPNHVTSPSVPESVDRWLRVAGDWQEEFAILARASSVFRQAVRRRCDVPGHRPD